MDWARYTVDWGDYKVTGGRRLLFTSLTFTGMNWFKSEKIICQRDKLTDSHPYYNKATFRVRRLFFFKLTDIVMVLQHTAETLVTHNLMVRRRDCQWAKIRFVSITEVEWALPLVPLWDTAWMLIESQQGYGVVVDWHSMDICFCQPDITQWSDSAEHVSNPTLYMSLTQTDSVPAPCTYLATSNSALKAEVVLFSSFCLLCCHYDEAFCILHSHSEIIKQKFYFK